MDNGQIPPVQPMMSGVPPVQPYQPQMANGMPMIQQVQVPPSHKRDVVGIVKTIVIIVVSLIAVTFIGLFIWMFTQYDEAQSDVDEKVAVAVAEAKDEQTMKMEAEFLEREKYPYKTFSGPVDYGQLTFEYPKTWSVYIAETAVNGGDFKAYFNPGQVEAPVDKTVNALRVEILDDSFDDVVDGYRREVENKKGELSVSSTTVNGTAANRYVGKIPRTEFNGIFVVFKLRDKTVILRTDSVLFQEDFDKLIETVTFNA